MEITSFMAHSLFPWLFQPIFWPALEQCSPVGRCVASADYKKHAESAGAVIRAESQAVSGDVERGWLFWRRRRAEKICKCPALPKTKAACPHRMWRIDGWTTGPVRRKGGGMAQNGALPSETRAADVAIVGGGMV
ncbi:MAG: hypothetical protein ACREF6_08885, partial [Alphaproteobacteria bacterium]